jgi:hypothetical protein
MKNAPNKLAALVGFVVLGLSPSFVDFEQSPEYRWQVFAYYGVAIALISWGLWGGS